MNLPSLVALVFQLRSGAEFPVFLSSVLPGALNYTLFFPYLRLQKLWQYMQFIHSVKNRLRVPWSQQKRIVWYTVVPDFKEFVKDKC